ncbi:hypothetical protein L9F63_020599, partial [Diploptera punctata]
ISKYFLRQQFAVEITFQTLDLNQCIYRSMDLITSDAKRNVEDIQPNRLINTENEESDVAQSSSYKITMVKTSLICSNEQYAGEIVMKCTVFQGFGNLLNKLLVKVYFTVLQKYRKIQYYLCRNINKKWRKHQNYSGPNRTLLDVSSTAQSPERIYPSSRRIKALALNMRLNIKLGHINIYADLFKP